MRERIEQAPILHHPTDEEAVFLPANLLDKAATMLGKERGAVPRCCLLDADAELIPVAMERFGGTPCASWPCFHTKLVRIERDGLAMGLIGGAIGSPFAVLVVEQLIACGCRHVISYSSAGAIAEGLSLPCLLVPDRALRDEGTSYHYLPPATWVETQGRLANLLARYAEKSGLPVHRGATWTTDAPYRETQSQLARYRARGVVAVEMESAALLALAEVRQAEIASLLHITNSFATAENDFHKGSDDINERIVNCCFDTFTELFETGRQENEGKRDEGA